MIGLHVGDRRVSGCGRGSPEKGAADKIRL